MTRAQELLVNYREVTLNIYYLDMEIDKLSKMEGIGGPRPIRSAQLTGMPRGTNNPEAAEMQTISPLDEVILQLHERQAMQFEMMQEAREIVYAIADRRLHNIVYAYYMLGMSDEDIAEKEDMSQTHVNRLRIEYFRNLR